MISLKKQQKTEIKKRRPILELLSEEKGVLKKYKLLFPYYIKVKTQSIEKSFYSFSEFIEFVDKKERDKIIILEIYRRDAYIKSKNYIPASFLIDRFWKLKKDWINDLINYLEKNKIIYEKKI